MDRDFGSPQLTNLAFCEGCSEGQEDTTRNAVHPVGVREDQTIRRGLEQCPGPGHPRWQIGQGKEVLHTGPKPVVERQDHSSDHHSQCPHPSAHYTLLIYESYCISQLKL